jgi:hypothetical protein
MEQQGLIHHLIHFLAAAVFLVVLMVMAAHQELPNQILG